MNIVNIVYNPIRALVPRGSKKEREIHAVINISKDKRGTSRHCGVSYPTKNLVSSRSGRRSLYVYACCKSHSIDTSLIMLKGKFGKADLTSATRFQVKYLGSGFTHEPGVAGIENAVRRIQDEAKFDEKSWPKMLLHVEAEGVKLEEVKQTKSSSKESKFISLENISYCTLNRIDTTIFAFNHHKSPTIVECHAVACENEDKAKAIALALYAAFREGHFQKLRRERRKSFEQKNFGRKASFENWERSSSSSSSPATSPTQELSPNFENSAVESVYEVKHFKSTRDRLSSVEYDDQELELDKVIEDLLLTVEIEMAKIEQTVD